MPTIYDAERYEVCFAKGKIIVKEKKSDEQKWIERMNRSLAGSPAKVCVLYRQITVIDGKGHTGTAICHEEDEFSYEKGTAVAYARMRGLEVPEYVSGMPAAKPTAKPKIEGIPITFSENKHPMKAFKGFLLGQSIRLTNSNEFLEPWIIYSIDAGDSMAFIGPVSTDVNFIKRRGTWMPLAALESAAL